MSNGCIAITVWSVSVRGMDEQHRRIRAHQEVIWYTSCHKRFPCSRGRIKLQARFDNR